MTIRNSKQAEDKRSASQGVQVIARAAEILRVLMKESGLSLGQIAERVGLARSTVQRIVGALQAEGLVMAMSPGGGLGLGPEIQSLAIAARIETADMVRPILTKIARTTGETVDLAVFRGERMVFIDQIVGTQRLRTVSAVGESFPMTTTANGKAALAVLDEETARELVNREIRAETRAAGASAKSISDIMGDIDQVRREGIAWDLDEHTDGISAAGVAFHAPDGNLNAISIPVPSHRFAGKRDLLAKALAEALNQIKGTVGFGRSG